MSYSPSLRSERGSSGRSPVSVALDRERQEAAYAQVRRRRKELLLLRQQLRAAKE